MMEAQKEKYGTAQGQRSDLGYEKTQVTLAQAGIDKNLAHRARSLARMSEEAFSGDD
jgi:hypothetical protein